MNIKKYNVYALGATGCENWHDCLLTLSGDLEEAQNMCNLCRDVNCTVNLVFEVGDNLDSRAGLKNCTGCKHLDKCNQLRYVRNEVIAR